MSPGPTIITSVVPTEGYSLAQLIQRVREVLPQSRQSFILPALGQQGFNRAEMRDYVREVLRDNDGEFVTNDDINDLLNQAQADLAARTTALRTSASGITLAGPMPISLPDDLLSMLYLTIAGVPAEAVDDETWWDWVRSEATPPRPIYRVVGDSLEVYPTQVTGVAYALRYVQRPPNLVSDTDKPTLPVVLQLRMVAYARAHSLRKTHEFEAADRYTADYEKDLGPQLVGIPPELVSEGKGPQARILTDAEITDYINEGLIEVASRTGVVRLEDSGPVDSSGVPLPSRFLRAISLNISGATSDVEFTDDDTFSSFRAAASTPSRTLARIFGGYVELYPMPAPAAAYTFEYVARPATLVAGDDHPDVPLFLQKKAIDFARHHAMLAIGMVKEAEQAGYFALAMEGLGAQRITERWIEGPLQLVASAGPFDLDPDARHW